MSSQSPAFKKSPRKAFVERRAEPGRIGSLRWLKGLLARPLTLERRDRHWHLTLVERRRARPSDPLASLYALRAELRTRLLAHRDNHGTRSIRHLVYLHRELGREGWRAVDALPGKAIAKALAQAEMLVGDEPFAELTMLIERLRLAQVAASTRSGPHTDVPDIDSVDALEVSEATHEEFEEMERSWIGTLPPDMALPGRGS